MGQRIVGAGYLRVVLTGGWSEVSYLSCHESVYRYKNKFVAKQIPRFNSQFDLSSKNIKMNWASYM